jgi:hypothetical protein
VTPSCATSGVVIRVVERYKQAAGGALEAAGADILLGGGPDFRDPSGNDLQVVG